MVDHIAIDTAGDELRGAVLQLKVTSAGGSHGGPKEIHLDLTGHAPTVLRDVALLRDLRCPAEGAPRPIEAKELKREALGLFEPKRMTAGLEARLGEALEGGGEGVVGGIGPPD